MWGRLTKKLADIAATHATAGDNNDAGEGSADAPATSSKKRKATSTSQADKSTAKGKMSHTLEMATTANLMYSRSSRQEDQGPRCGQCQNRGRDRAAGQRGGCLTSSMPTEVSLALLGWLRIDFSGGWMVLLAARVRDGSGWP